MSYEGPSICEDCQRDQHCVWGGFGLGIDIGLGCACACPNPRHFSGGNLALEAHLETCRAYTTENPIGTMQFCGDDWYCPVGRELDKNADAWCGAIWNSSAAWSDTNMWSHVTCPACLALRPPFDREHA